ncbi:hypothetical protein [Paraburkholderia hospita]|nr:hypothetical protein [Paraburkholderia hospita]SKC92217.1 hypothetical protein SAMN05446934_6021 [Paraburkholderia hospita]
MKNTNQRAAPIAWRKGELVCTDTPLCKPAVYYAAVRGTDALFKKLGVK